MSQRRRSKNALRAAGNKIEAAQTDVYRAMTPYFDRFPGKKAATRAIIEAMEVMRDTIQNLLADV